MPTPSFRVAVVLVLHLGASLEDLLAQRIRNLVVFLSGKNLANPSSGNLQVMIGSGRRWELMPHRPQILLILVEAPPSSLPRPRRKKRHRICQRSYHLTRT